MPDTRSRRDVAPGRAARKAWLVAIAVFAISAAVSGAASSGGSGHALHQATTGSGAHARAGGVAVLPAANFARVGAPGEALAVAPAPGPRPPAAAPTMSMDTPIQGGLSAREEQAISARLRESHHDAAIATPSRYWTPAMARTAVARAQSWLGMPYSWAGGNASGPSPGRCDPGSGADLDCNVVGFDCSGLTMYAWGAYTALPHLADAQRAAGAFHPTLKQLLPGDLVFFSAYLSAGTGHVAIYTGGGMVIEAPQSGSVVHRAPLADLLAEDGVYRGAVRPLTGTTPTLTAPRATVPPAGGTVTLRGAHLAGVDAVHLDGYTVRSFTQHSDSTIAFHAPAHAAGRVSVSVSTSWQAVSRSVTLTYLKPRPTSPVTSPASPTSPSAPTAPASPTKPTTPTSSTPTSPTGSSTTPPAHSSSTDSAPTSSAPAPTSSGPADAPAGAATADSTTTG